LLLVGKGKNGGAVWLQHSVPRFVDDVTKEYEYPHSGRENGQLFFCTSFPFEAVETICTLSSITLSSFALAYLKHMFLSEIPLVNARS
ncbi:hypothetical protein MRX96_042733, partial [Rhipicephalus microplus]